MKSGFCGAEYVAVDTDEQALNAVLSRNRIHVTENISECASSFDRAFKNTDIVFIIAGMGGETGSLVSSVIAESARSKGALTVSIVTKPFNHEGSQFKHRAEEGIQKLHSSSDAIIAISNEKLSRCFNNQHHLSGSEFEIASNVIQQIVRALSDIINIDTELNVSFTDICDFLKDAGYICVSIGKCTGEDRVLKAAQTAIKLPFTEIDISGAKSIIINVQLDEAALLSDLDNAVNVVASVAHPDVKILYGAGYDKTSNGESSILVLASGFDESKY